MAVLRPAPSFLVHTRETKERVELYAPDDDCGIAKPWA